MGADGEPALQALFEPLHVIAAGPAGRFHVTTDTWGPYQLVLPPGDFEVWVERLGAVVRDFGGAKSFDIAVLTPGEVLRSLREVP